MNRRSFVTGAALLVAPPRVWAQPNLEREHRPQLDVPQIAEDPTAVPVAVSVDHPMDTDHFIRSIEVTLDNDPVPYKGTFLLGPANGRAAIAFKMRSGAGGQLKAVLECSRHGRFTRDAGDPGRRRRLHDPSRNDRAGAPAQPPDSASRADRAGTDRRGPRSRRAPFRHRAALARREIRPRGTGVLPEGNARLLRWPEDHRIPAEPGGESQSLIRFPLKVTHPGALKVIFVNNEGQRAEVSQPVRF